MILSPLCDEPKGLKTKLCMVGKGYGRREEGMTVLWCWFLAVWGRFCALGSGDGYYDFGVIEIIVIIIF